MWFGEPHPFPERGSPTGLSTSGQQSYEGWSCRLCYSYNKNQLDSLISQIYFRNKTLHVFGQFLCPSSGGFSLYTQQWCMQTLKLHKWVNLLVYIHVHTHNFTDLWNFSMTYTTVVFTVKNSWWWTKELSETCRVLFQK